MSLFGKTLEEYIRRVECVIARGGSSSQGLCIFHTGAADALCSGPTRPTRPVSPEVAGTEKQNHSWNDCKVMSSVLLLGI